MNRHSRIKFLKNLIIVSLVLSSVFALDMFFSKRQTNQAVVAGEKNISHKDKMMVYAGGENIGIKISTKGVLVVAFSDIELENGDILESPAEKFGVEVGDIILKINGKCVKSSKDFIKFLNETDKESVAVEILREEKILNKDIHVVKSKNGIFKAGMWVRDSTAGIGTLTFVEPNTKVYGGLGHPITDSMTEQMLTIDKGTLLSSSIIDVRKGEIGRPGELRGVLNKGTDILGSIGKNTRTGIYGVLDDKYIKLLAKNNDKLYEVGFSDEVVVGDAKILTTIDEEGPKEFTIKIEKNIGNSKGPNKNMVIKVTDPVLLQKTGGIVQGMSGSPIIQNGKIIGAVTHVLVNKPNVGYGIYIENMLKDANLIK